MIRKYLEHDDDIDHINKKEIPNMFETMDEDEDEDEDEDDDDDDDGGDDDDDDDDHDDDDGNDSWHVTDGGDDDCDRLLMFSMKLMTAMVML